MCIAQYRVEVKKTSAVNDTDLRLLRTSLSGMAPVKSTRLLFYNRYCIILHHFCIASPFKHFLQNATINRKK